MSKLLEFNDGKMKLMLMIFGGCLLAFIFSLFIIFGIGGAIGISIGIIIALVSLIFGILTGIMVGSFYLDWADE